MHTLYFALGTCALASHIALLDASAEYKLKRVDTGAGEQQSPDYLALNPKGRIPTLVTPQGSLSETPAILAFIAQSHPEAELAPFDDPFTLAELQAFNSYLCSTVHVAHAHRMRGTRWVDDTVALEAMKKKVPETVSACFELIDTQMLKGPWVMGKAYTIADPYLFTLAQWMESDGIDPSRFQRVLDHRTRMAERPNTKTALAEQGASLSGGCSIL